MFAFLNSSIFDIAFSGSIHPDKPGSHLFINTIFFLTAVFAVLLVSIFAFLIYKNKRAAMKSRWQGVINIIIQTTIFNEDEKSQAPVTKAVRRLLKRKAFRADLTDEIVAAKKSFSGAAGKSLQMLYQQLGLHKDSLKRVHSSSWHVRAKGIQELATMVQKETLDEIYELTNNKNEQVRIEAQNAVVLMSGFQGLRFLDFLVFPISEWQQIKLLTALEDNQHGDAEWIRRWLDSKNPSVVIFALKLVAIYYHFELHDEVIRCLAHPNPSIRSRAVNTLKEIYTGETATKLIELYQQEDLKNKLAILDVMKAIGTEEDIPFLQEQLEQESNQVKLAAARAIATIAQGTVKLEAFHYATQYPWNEIIEQIKEEQAA